MGAGKEKPTFIFMNDRSLERGDTMGVGKKKPGFIFMCNIRTKGESFAYRVFGCLDTEIDVKKIEEGSKLFLYDCDLKLLHGIYEAKSRGGFNLEKDAFGGKYPAQVRFEIMEDCFPLSESQLRDVIPENYDSDASKFKPKLSYEQVELLCSLFVRLPSEIKLPMNYWNGPKPYPAVPYAVAFRCDYFMGSCTTSSSMPVESEPAYDSTVSAMPETGHS